MIKTDVFCLRECGKKIGKTAEIVCIINKLDVSPIYLCFDFEMKMIEYYADGGIEEQKWVSVRELCNK